MLEERNHDMKEMREQHKDFNMWREYSNFLDNCKSNPTVLYDVAAVIDNQGNGVQTEQVFDAFNNACRPAYPVLGKFVRKFKVIHFKLQTDLSKRKNLGYEYKFNQQTGELDIYVFRDGQDITAKTFKWLESQ